MPAVGRTGRFPVDYDSLYDLAARVANIRLPDKAVAEEWEAMAGQLLRCAPKGAVREYRMR